MTPNKRNKREARISFPALNRNGKDSLIQVLCVAHFGESANPQTPDRRFEEVIRRHRGLEGAGNPPFTFFDTKPRLGEGYKIVGDSFQLAVVLADRMARHGSNEDRNVIATGCMPGNDGSVSVVDGIEFGRKLDLVAATADQGSVFIFPRANVQADIRDKLEALKTNSCIDLRPIGNIDELRGTVLADEQKSDLLSKPRSARPVARSIGWGLLISLPVLIFAYFIVPAVYDMALPTRGDSAPESRDSRPQSDRQSNEAGSLGAPSADHRDAEAVPPTGNSGNGGQETSPKKEADVSKPSDHGSTIDSSAAAQKQADASKSINGRSEVGGIICVGDHGKRQTQVQGRLSLIQAMFLPAERDKEYAIMVGQLLKCDQLQDALEVAQHIFLPLSRDSALGTIVSRAIEKGMSELARDAIDQVFIPQTRDRLLKQMIAAQAGK
jgi:hypothetical protein